MSGKKSPDLEFLVKCKEYFALDNRKIIDLFRTALSSSTVITLDMSYLPKKNKQWIVDVLPPFLLFPKMQYCTGDELAIEGAVNTIKRVLTDTTNKNALNPMRKDDEKK
jgi:hypothetical protein